MTAAKRGSAFGRLRTSQRNGEVFTPSPVLTGLSGRELSSEIEAVTPYVSLAEFSRLSGLGIDLVEKLVLSNAISYLPSANAAEIRINYAKALAQIERLEKGPHVRNTPLDRDC